MDETSRRMRLNLHLMNLGNNDEFREEPGLSLAATVAHSGAVESGVRVNLLGHYVESGESSTVCLHSLLLPIFREINIRSTVVAQRGRELPAVGVCKIVSLLSSTEMAIDQIAQRMGCSPSTVKKINRMFRLRDYGGRRNTWRSYAHDETKRRGERVETVDSCEDSYGAW